MAAYKLMKVDASLIQRASDGAFIPASSGNGDYEDYLAWVALGNTPDPAPE